MHPARLLLIAGTIGALSVAGMLSAQQEKPAAPMKIEKVKDGLYLIRGPFNRCAPNGCGGGYGDDGLLHWHTMPDSYTNESEAQLLADSLNEWTEKIESTI